MVGAIATLTSTTAMAGATVLVGAIATLTSTTAMAGAPAVVETTVVVGATAALASVTAMAGLFRQQNMCEWPALLFVCVEQEVVAV